MSDSALVDTNVLIYSETTTDENKHQTAIKRLQEFRSSYDLCLSVQNMNELANTLLISDYETSFNLIYWNIETIKEATKLSRTHGIHFYDALLSATMKEHLIDIIITENEKDFKKIPWMTVINPFKI
ncbi:PIN domain-containing protein [Candidatus Micrarchaeota archaeon]|nr:PIN domain-containing protein [Candidatus Micrarchaeota archaeon]